MSTREALLQRNDVPDEDIDDIIEIAAQLQDAERDVPKRASVEDVRKVAAELDIDPKHVQAAIAKLEQSRAEQAAQAEQQAAASARTAKTIGLVGVGLIALLVLGGLGATGVVGAVTLSASSSMSSARVDQRRAEAKLAAVLDRQATLAPQLIALAGGDAAELNAGVAQLRDAPDIQAKLAASDALGLAMATALGALPPATDPATQQSRADLQYEVSGIANRITVERRRYDEASLRYDEASTGIGAGIARQVGLAL